MPLITLERTPPPFFHQGPSAVTRLAFFAALALFLMVADARFAWTPALRDTLAVALAPLQRVVRLPLEAVTGMSDYLRGLAAAREAERQAHEALAAQSARAARAEQLAQDNARLRALLELRPALALRSLPAEVLYEAADPYSRKLFIDRGTMQGVVLAAPVINEAGVLGQVTRLYPHMAEVTLLADKDAAIPVLNLRTQLRGAAFGGGSGGTMDLRFTSANADVRVGDLLHTSGLDGVYPPGLPVATVLSVERRAESGFARIALGPVASPDGARFVLVIEPVGRQLPPQPAAAPEPKPARGDRGSRPGAASAPAGRAAP
jgi:rod shape-determining protein MreC